MKKIVLFSIAASTCFNLTVNAQLKRLSQQQTFGNQPSLTKIVNPVMGWDDDNHYIEMDAADRKLYTVEVQSGDRTAYTAPKKSNANVRIDDNDIYIQYGKEAAKKLTSTKAEEKNPTLSPDGKYVAFTRDNDLYSIEVATEKKPGIRPMGQM